MTTRQQLREQWKAWTNALLRSAVTSSGAAIVALLGGDMGGSLMETGRPAATLPWKAYIVGVLVAVAIATFRHAQASPIPDLFAVDDDAGLDH